MPMPMPGQNPPENPARKYSRIKIEKPEPAKLIDFIVTHLRSGIVTRTMHHDEYGELETIAYMIQDDAGDYLIQPLAIIVTPELETQLHEPTPG